MSKFVKPRGCYNWASSAPERLEHASFLVLEPQAELCDPNGDRFYGEADLLVATNLAISAHFPLEPPWICADFTIQDLELALKALLAWKGSRPIFYRDFECTFELKATSVRNLLTELRDRVPIDQLG